MDIAGNVMFSGTIISILVALTWAGTVYKWQDYRIISPLIIGFFGVGLWLTSEWTLIRKPSFPRQFVTNRTSVTVLVTRSYILSPSTGLSTSFLSNSKPLGEYLRSNQASRASEKSWYNERVAVD
jgi:hypothetical protein